MNHLASITVTYKPDIAILKRQLAGLPADCLKILVDNGSSAEDVAALRGLAASFPGVRLVENPQNEGLPAALNRGVLAALSPDPAVSHLLLLDQDSEFAPSLYPTLVQAFEDLRAAGMNPGAVGPRIVDVQTGLHHGFHTIKGLLWQRVIVNDEQHQAVECAGLNCSGTVTTPEIFLGVGGMDASLFIDQLDADFSFRVTASGRKLLGIPWVTMPHRMGERSFRFWLGGWKVWPYRPPHRHYYVFRNAVLLLRRPYAPPVWKLWAVPKLVLTAVAHGLFDTQRSAQLRQMARGVRDGLSAANSGGTLLESPRDPAAG